MNEPEINLRDLQLAELEILKEFIRVCDELNLKYFLDSGTLLGCIRHKGFIPWDDDIDVSMPRKDYDIFMEKGQSLLKENYFLQNYNTDSEFTMTYSKIRNSNTTFIESSVKNLKINHGVYIDIFPIDGYNPKHKIRNYIREKKYVLYNIQINKKYSYSNTNNSLKNKVLRLMSNILYGKYSIHKILAKKDKIAQKCKYDENEYIVCYSYSVGKVKDNYMKKIYFQDGQIKTFEGIEVRVPSNYDLYLKRMYGNYMELPPEEKRIAHHYNEIIDLNKSYREYIK